MEAILLKITEKYWLKYRSIPFVVIVAAAFCVPFIPKTGEESFLQVVIAAAIGIAVNLFYLFCCISANKLPRAKKGKTAVLFVVDAESEQLYKDVKNKLIQAFKVDYNIVRIIDFIEYIKAEEPERKGLYLALGLCYEKVGDYALAKQNYEQYISYGIDEQTKDFLAGRIDAFPAA